MRCVAGAIRGGSKDDEILVGVRELVVVVLRGRTAAVMVEQEGQFSVNSSEKELAMRSCKGPRSLRVRGIRQEAGV